MFVALFLSFLFFTSIFASNNEKDKYLRPLKTMEEVKDEILWTLGKDFTNFTPDLYKEIEYEKFLTLYETSNSSHSLFSTLDPKLLYYVLILPFEDLVTYQENLPISFQRVLPNFRNVSSGHFELTMDKHQKLYQEGELKWQNLYDHPTQNFPNCIDIFSFAAHGPYWPLVGLNDPTVSYSKSAYAQATLDPQNGESRHTSLQYEVLNYQVPSDDIKDAKNHTNIINEKIPEFRRIRSDPSILPFNTDTPGHLDIHLRHATSFFEQSRNSYGRGSYLVFGQKAFVFPSGHVVFDGSVFHGQDGCETRWFQIRQSIMEYLDYHAISDLFPTSSSDLYYGHNLLNPTLNEKDPAYFNLLNETYTNFLTYGPDFLIFTDKSPRIGHFKKVFIAPTIWDFNYHHFLSDSVSRMYGMLEFLQKNTDVMIHLRHSDLYDYNLNEDYSFKLPASFRLMRQKILKFLKLNPSRVVYGFFLADEVIVSRPARCAFALSNPYHMNYLSKSIFDSVLEYLVDRPSLTQFLPFYKNIHEVFTPAHPLLAASRKKVSTKLLEKKKLNHQKIKTDSTPRESVFSLANSKNFTSVVEPGSPEEDSSHFFRMVGKHTNQGKTGKNEIALSEVEGEVFSSFSPFSPSLSTASTASTSSSTASPASPEKYILFIHRYSLFPDYRNWDDTDFTKVTNAFRKYFPGYKLLFVSDRLEKALSVYRINNGGVVDDGFKLDMDKSYEPEEISAYYDRLSQSHPAYFSAKNFSKATDKQLYKNYFDKQRELDQEDIFVLDVMKFARADIIVTGHGAGETNLIFSRPGALIVEISGQVDDVILPVCGYYPNIGAMNGQHHLLYSYNYYKSERMDYDFLAKETLIYWKALEFRRQSFKNLYGINAGKQGQPIQQPHQGPTKDIQAAAEKSFNARFPFIWYNVKNIDYFNHQF